MQLIIYLNASPKILTAKNRIRTPYIEAKIEYEVIYDIFYNIFTPDLAPKNYNCRFLFEFYYFVCYAVIHESCARPNIQLERMREKRRGN